MRVVSITETNKSDNKSITVIGREYTQPYLGKSYNAYPISRESNEQGLDTQQVLIITDQNNFETKDYTYKLKLYDITNRV